MRGGPGNPEAAVTSSQLPPWRLTSALGASKIQPARTTTYLIVVADEPTSDGASARERPSDRVEQRLSGPGMDHGQLVGEHAPDVHVAKRMPKRSEDC
jgi:hypothetical protein